jgi:hypothetical protein
LFFRLGNESVATECAQRELADAEPVEDLVGFAAQVNVHFAK